MFKAEKEEVAYFMRRLYQQKLTTTSGGNVSFRIDDEHILITASQTDKARISPGEIGVVDLSGKSKTPELKLSMETGMHLSVFRKRKDVKAIVHAHPVHASVFCVTDKDINCCLMGEQRYVLGTPLKAEYALMGTPELAEIVSEVARKTNVVLMKNHGILCVGESLLQAFDRLEVVEAAARTTLLTNAPGRTTGLTNEQLREIDGMREQ